MEKSLHQVSCGEDAGSSNFMETPCQGVLNCCCVSVVYSPCLKGMKPRKEHSQPSVPSDETFPWLPCHMKTLCYVCFDDHSPLAFIRIIGFGRLCALVCLVCVCVLGGEETGLAATWLLARQSILSLKMLLTCCRTDVELSFWKPLHSTSRETSVLDVLLSLCIACPSMTKSRLYKDCLKFKLEEKCRDDVWCKLCL